MALDKAAVEHDGRGKKLEREGKRKGNAVEEERKQGNRKEGRGRERV